jgi:glycogen debranching enzyme
VDRAGRSITLRDSLLRALGWIVGRLDHPDGGGYLWVRPSGPRSIANQVWDDSYDAYYHADGTLFDPGQPYAPVAVQGYAYDALVGAAALLERTRRTPTLLPDWLRGRARQLRAQVLAELWQADMHTFAIAVARGADGHWRPARVVGSNAGHLLASRLLDGDDASEVRKMLIERLFEPDLLGGAGIRTRSTTAARFRPGSYHNGSIWPMDCGVISDGLRRHAEVALADDLDRRILAACRVAGSLPEFFRGDLDGGIAINTAVVDAVADGAPRRLEQPPQLDQGWTATRAWRTLRQRQLLDIC